VITIGILAAFVAYYAFGVQVAARPYIARQVREHAERWPSIAEPPQLAAWRRDAAFEGLFVALAWPVYFVFRAAVTALASSVPMPTDRPDKERNL
jgi:hypothetical protein